MRLSYPLLVSLSLVSSGCGLARAIFDDEDASTEDSGSSTSALVDSGSATLPGTDTGTPGGADTGTPGAEDTGAAPLDLPYVVTSLTLPTPGEVLEATSDVELSWEGEVLVGTPMAEVAVDGATLFVYNERTELRVAEERLVTVSLEVPAAEVVAGATVEGTLFYAESPVDPPWLDVLLSAPVDVEVADDPDQPGALVLTVAEVPLAPAFGVGVMRAGDLYEGPYDLAIAPDPVHDCGSLTSDQLAFVEQSLGELADEQNELFQEVDYAAFSRGGQGGDPMRPFVFSSDLVEHLTSWNGSYSPGRVPDSGGILELTFLPPTVSYDGYLSSAPMDLRESAGLYEVGRRLTVDGRAWLPGFPVTVERFYASTDDATLDEATCVTTHEGSLQTFGG